MLPGTELALEEFCQGWLLHDDFAVSRTPDDRRTLIQLVAVITTFACHGRPKEESSGPWEPDHEYRYAETYISLVRP